MIFSQRVKCIYYIGIDIGGTKCAVSLGCSDGQGTVRVLHKCDERPR